MNSPSSSLCILSVLCSLSLGSPESNHNGRWSGLRNLRRRQRLLHLWSARIQGSHWVHMGSRNTAFGLGPIRAPNIQTGPVPSIFVEISKSPGSFAAKFGAHLELTVSFFATPTKSIKCSRMCIEDQHHQAVAAAFCDRGALFGFLYRGVGFLSKRVERPIDDAVNLRQQVELSMYTIFSPCKEPFQCSPFKIEWPTKCIHISRRG